MYISASDRDPRETGNASDANASACRACISQHAGGLMQWLHWESSLMPQNTYHSLCLVQHLNNTAIAPVWMHIGLHYEAYRGLQKNTYALGDRLIVNLTPSWPLVITSWDLQSSHRSNAVIIFSQCSNHCSFHYRLNCICLVNLSQHCLLQLVQ